MYRPLQRRDEEKRKNGDEPEAAGQRGRPGLGLLSYRDAKEALRPTDSASGAETTMAPEKAPTTEAPRPDGTPQGTFAAAQAAYTAHRYLQAATWYHEVYGMKDVTADQKGSISFNLAQCHRMLGNPADAARWYRICLDSGSTAASTYRGEIETRLAEMNASKLEGDKAPATDAGPVTGDSRQVFEAATKLYAGGGFLSALALYLKVAEDKSLGDAALSGIAFNIAQCYRLTGQSLDALGWYQRALALGGVEAYRAEIERRIAEAEAALVPEARTDKKSKGPKSTKKPKAAKAKDPIQEARDLFSYAQDLYEQGYHEGAADAYLEVYYHPGLTDVIKSRVAFNLAQCFRLTNQPRLAITWYEMALKSGGVEEYRKEIERHLVALRGGNETKTGASTTPAANDDDAKQRAPLGR